MTEQRRVRSGSTEQKYAFFLNAVVVMVLLAAAVLLLPQSGPIGPRTMVVLYALDGVMTLALMYLLEKYTVAISGLYEKFLITVLSCIYTLGLMCLINGIFFTSKERLAADVVLAVVKIAGVFAADGLLEKVLGNEAYFKKPKLLIVGSTAENFPRMKRMKYGVLKNYDSWYESTEGMDTAAFEQFVTEQFPHYDAVCILDGLSDAEYHAAVNTAMKRNQDLFIVPKMIDVGKTNARLVRFDDVLTLYMPKKSLTRMELGIKRVVDLVAAAVGIIIAAVPMAVIAAAIKLTSPGPVFYKQVRLTQYQKEFEMYKFRTMIPDAEKLSGPKFAEKDDPRITPVGRILRACRLDELPQLVNILKGDMSVVGPRPERPVFVKLFAEEIENYNYRFAVKAGLTSLSHVYGRYSTYIHDRTYYDLFYITHYSLLLDFKIMLLTTKTVFLKSAAEGENDFKEKTVAKTQAEVKTH